MEQEGSRKRHATKNCDYDVVDKKPRTPATNEPLENNGQDVVTWLTLHDETVTELSELLDSPEVSVHQQFNFKVKFIEDPYTMPVVFQSSSAYVTINGNEESCGSSFSDSESTVMASVDMGSFRCALRKLSRELNVDGDDDGAWASSSTSDEQGARGWIEESNYVEGIFVKSLSGCHDLFGTPPPPSMINYGTDSGDGDNETWVNFLGDDLFGGPW